MGKPTENRGLLALFPTMQILYINKTNIEKLHRYTQQTIQVFLSQLFILEIYMWWK